MRATSIEERLADFVIRVFDAMGICIWTWQILASRQGRNSGCSTEKLGSAK